MTAFALIPIKRFDRGKTRLGERLGTSERAELARGMFEHVLAASLGCAALSGVLVVSDSAEIAELARDRGAQTLSDPPTPLAPLARGGNERARLAEVVDAALAHLREQRVATALVLMADLPLLRSSDLDQLLLALAHHDLVLAADARGQCTNALALRLAAAVKFETAFGSAQSLALHEARARALGLSLWRESNPRLALDIDLPADLDALARSREDG